MYKIVIKFVLCSVHSYPIGTLINKKEIKIACNCPTCKNLTEITVK